MGGVYKGVWWDFVFQIFEYNIQKINHSLVPTCDRLFPKLFFKGLYDGSKLTMDKSKNNLVFFH